MKLAVDLPLPQASQPDETVVDFPAVPSPSAKLVHPTRGVSDADLRGEVRLVEWTEERFMQFAAFRQATAGKTDDRIPAIEHVAGFLHTAWPTTYMLGDFQGLVIFYPVIPGGEAQVHIFIWDPLYLRRQPLLRALARMMFRKYDLRRICACIPSTNPLPLRLARSLGFVEEGRLRAGVVYNGEEKDLVVLGLTRKEVF